MTYLFTRMWGVVALALAITGCASYAARPTLSASEFTAPDPVDPIQAPESYRINAGDQFSVKIFGVEDLSGGYYVEPSGTVGFPLIGSLSVIGMTTPELSDKLTQLYGQRYLRNPNVSIQMTEFTKATFTVSGSVGTPGVYQTIGTTNLVRAVARAGGPNEIANPKRVAIFRNIDGARHVAAFDLKRIEAGLDPNPTVYGGDEIVMDGSNLKQAMRDLISLTPILGIYRLVTR